MQNQNNGIIVKLNKILVIEKERYVKKIVQKQNKEKKVDDSVENIEREK